ncbi:MAG TPA: hypothetical protein GXX37_05005 [Clostridiaceae bacterium]|nr:hypothetical protein [Clostridiaceae bacterium]
MLKNYIKNGLKVLGDYCAGLLIYFILLYTFIAITGEKFSFWLPLYSVLMFIIIALLIYSDMWNLAVKEKRPQYDLNPYPMKGLIIGLIGFFPIVVISLVAFLVSFSEPVLNNLKDALLHNILLGPLYFVISIFGKKVYGYIIGMLLVPLFSMFGYLMGFYGKTIRKRKEVTMEKKQELSPWNPYRKDTDDKKKKKKKKTNRV